MVNYQLKYNNLNSKSYEYYGFSALFLSSR